MFSEKILTVFGSLLITIYTARYLGPEKLGIITYALSLVALIIPIAQLGTQTLIFDRIVKNKESGIKLVISSTMIRWKIYLILSITGICFFSVDSTTSKQEIIVLLLAICSGYFTVQDAYAPYFDATLKAKVNSIASQVGLIIALAFRLILVLISAQFIFFVIPYIVQSAIPYFIRKKYFLNEAVEIKGFQNKQKYNKFIFGAGVPLALSSFSVVVYLKVSQIIIANKFGSFEVGIYSAASLISQGWNFLPIIVMTVLLTKVLNDKNNKNKGFSFVFFVCSFLCLLIIMVVGSMKVLLLELTFGSEFIDAVPIITPMLFATLFSVLGTISYRVIISSGGYKFLMIKMFFSAVVNVILCYILIDVYGLLGAAYSLLITEILSSTLFNYPYRKGLVFHIHKMIPFSFGYWKELRT